MHTSNAVGKFTAEVLEVANLDEAALLQEHRIDLWIHDLFWTSITCTPCDLHDLLLGRLVTAGIVGSKEAVETINLLEQATCAKVLVKDEYRQEALKAAEISSGVKGERGILGFELNRFPLRRINWEPQWIQQMADALENKTPLYAATHSAHSSLVLCEGNILCLREDMARHNAIDKVVGWTEQKGIDRSNCILFTSGRIPVDMATKGIRAGFSVMASKALPTQQAVELAKNYRLTLLHISKRMGLVRFS